ncbi:MAG: RNA polymerase sigma-54 factor [Hyphomicrobium sp.]|nr:RNA polymerase sigma-54 factor [Hyphomicrobium sp.]PPC82062.1 MAG: RNA polymerase sigma-54 factor [Hyphomicrobium sp.]
MTLSTRLELRQGQQLVMTPQLQQAIRLLQLSNIELSQFVDTELERNPLLEREETDEPSAPTAGDEADQRNNSGTDHENDGDSDASLGGAEFAGEGTSDDAWLDLGKTDVDPAGALDTSIENVFPDTVASDPDMAGNANGLSNWASVHQSTNNFSGDDSNLEEFVSSETSLRDHLEQQLTLALADPVERLVGRYLIDLVDEAGYLRADLPSLADKLGAPLEFVERVLGTLQTFDPPGVFARSLAECLAIQLKEENRYDPMIARFLDNLHLVASHNLAGLRKAIDADADDLADMITDIKRLNPKPGLRFGRVDIQRVVPDVLVRSAADGSFIVELNTDTLPRVLVNRSYYTKVTKSAHSEKDKGYILECLQTASWLVKSLDQRARTILRVSEEIIRQQDGFFTYGVQHLRPLNLRTVADAIKMHESTVSRVTSNKYMSTPRGIFELKYFFTSAIQSSEDGEAHSSESVRHRIKQLIDGETPKAVLSDDKIVERLRKDGIDIARRTVAKYREAMRIASSVQRRREKRMTETFNRSAAE